MTIISMENKISKIKTINGFGEVTEYKYSELELCLNGESEVEASFPTGMAKRRINQMENVGFSVSDIIVGLGDEVHHQAIMVFKRN